VANIAAAAAFSALTNYRTAAKQTPLLPHQQGEKKRKFWHLKRATKIEKYKRNIQTTAEAI